MTGPMPTWDEVLAAVESDAARAAELLYGPTQRAVALDPPLELPPLAQMPPVPDELRARIEALRARIDDLADELRAALAACPQPLLHQPSRLPAHVAPAVAVPVYLDRTA